MATQFSESMKARPSVAGEAGPGVSVCKVCGGDSPRVFGLPSSKLAGHPIPDGPDDCPYFRCSRCNFLFTHLLDDIDNTQVYDDTYWDHQDPDWHGRVNQTLRLVMLANLLLSRLPWELEICDFGCGMGTFVSAGREHLGLRAWGHDIIEPKFGREYFLPELPEGRFDVVTACEVIEHLPDPVAMIEPAIRALRPGGVFAFQTAEYDPASCGRDWWYLGPANGHVSLYSRGALDVLFERFGGTRRLLYDGYGGVQAWQIGGADPPTLQRAQRGDAWRRLVKRLVPRALRPKR